MKIFIICSKAFYDRIAPIKEELEKMGHTVDVPHTYDDPEAEQRSWDLGDEEHGKFKRAMFEASLKKIMTVDAVLALNFDKNGKKNYIGGSTFLELYDAFREKVKIYLYNDIPDGILHDEISGFSPVIIHGDLTLIK